jgi:Carboxypeptidase regulatory-like domain
MPRHLRVSLALVLAVATHLCAQNAPPKYRVSGKVVNAVNGHALAGAEVWLGNAEDFDATQQKLLTGDDGAFKFMVADPGKYLLGGQANGFRRQGFEQHGMYVSAIVVGPGLNTENVVFRLRPDARVLGVIEDEEHEPVAGATIYLFRTDATFGFRQTSLSEQTVSDDRGHYRFAHLEPGFYYLAVSAAMWFSGLLQPGDALANSAPSQKPEFDMAFPTTLYPGVTDAASASQIAVNEGEDFTADFTLNPVPGLHVRVNHVNAVPEKPISATLQQRVFGTTINQTWLRQVQVDDSLEIRGVTPGRYVLEIESYDASRGKRSTVVNLTADTEVDPETTSAVVPIHGIVHMQGGLNLSHNTLVRLFNSRSGDVLDSQIEAGRINFDSDSLTPGTYSVYAMNGDNSIMSSLKATGAQVAGQTVQITGGKPVELDIEMSNTLAKINGTAKRDGKSVAGAMILLVPEDAEANLPKFRRDESDSDGTYTLRDVLPGRYRILAIEDGWELEWGNLSLLKNRLEHAQKIEVQPNKTYQTVLNVE